MIMGQNLVPQVNRTSIFHAASILSVLSSDFLAICEFGAGEWKDSKQAGCPVPIEGYLWKIKLGEQLTRTPVGRPVIGVNLEADGD